MGFQPVGGAFEGELLDRANRRIKMRKMIIVSVSVFFASLMAGGAVAQNLVIYPAKGQSQE